MGYGSKWRWAGDLVHKYKAKGERTVDGWFPSRGELARWKDLQLLQAAGAITGLARQVAFPLTTISPNGEQHQIGRYIADYVYREVVQVEPLRVGPVIVEDYKGMRTELYQWKRKHLELEYAIILRETR